MRLNINLYKSIIPSIISIAKNNPTKVGSELIGLCSVATGAHIIACAYYLSFLEGHKDLYKEHIDKLKSFYKIEFIDGLEDFFDERGQSKRNPEGSIEV